MARRLLRASPLSGLRLVALFGAALHAVAGSNALPDPPSSTPPESSRPAPPRVTASRPPRPVASNNTVLYAIGAVAAGDTPVTNVTVAQLLGASGFSTVILGFLHYHYEHPDPSCRLAWDDVSICEFPPGAVREWVAALRAAKDVFKG